MITTETLKELFDKYEDEYIEFSRVTNPHSKLRDVNAFLLLAELFPEQKGDIVSWAEHDRIGLAVDPDELAQVATDEHVLELIRSGVILDGHDTLVMFV